MSIVTKGGDARTTRLLSGEEVGKADPRLDACGIIDELNCQIGFARALAERQGGKCGPIAREIQKLQLDLFRLASEIACSDPKSTKWAEPTTAEHVKHIEKRIAVIEGRIELPRSFIIPGACEASAAMDVARAVSRRLERHAVAMAGEGGYSNEYGFVYLNRLSDYLFLLAREIDRCSGVAFCAKEDG